MASDSKDQVQSGISIFHTRFRDIDQMNEYIQPLMKVRSTQLKPGGINISVRMVTCGDIYLWYYSTSKAIYERYSIPHGRIEFALTRPSVTEPTVLNNCIVPSSAIGIIHPGKEYSSYNPSGMEVVALAIPEKWLVGQDFISPKNLMNTRKKEQVVYPLLHPRSIQFRNQLFRLFDIGWMHRISLYRKDDAILFKEWILEEMRSVLSEISHFQKNERRLKRKSRAEVLHAAMEIVDRSLEQPLSTNTLAIKVGTSPRILQYAFRDHLSLSPTRYILYRKLHAARADLKKIDNGSRAPVSDVAMYYRLEHFGRFSIEYKSLFGESPSDTLKKGPVKFQP